MTGILRTYFAYPHLLRGTALVQHLIDDVLIGRHGFSVVDPGTARYQEAYRKRRIAYPGEDPMIFWIELAYECDNCVFCPMPNVQAQSGNVVPFSQMPVVDARVATVVDFGFRARRKLVYWINPSEEPATLHMARSWAGFRRLAKTEPEAMTCANDPQDQS